MFAMLVVASVIGGLCTPVGLVLLVRLARDPQLMGDQSVSGRLALAGWMIAVVVGGRDALADVAGEPAQGADGVPVLLTSGPFGHPPSVTTPGR